jgi:hippurate hydrolase
MPDMTNDLLADARSALPDLVEVRRRIHRRPELALQLPETQAIIAEELGKLGLDAQLGKRVTSVTTVIGAERTGPVTILRADMDALPLTERTDLDFASEIDGRMHACGHDTHVAMLLGGARLLVERAADLAGPVLLMFQPGEEGFHGARFMLEDGLLDALDIARTRAFAIHISTMYVSGEIHLRPGPLLASADNFRITVRGRGGHASAPHDALDPIPVAAEIVTALEIAVTRQVNVFDPAVVTVAHIVAGTTHNVIPETAFLEGTYRTTSDVRRAATRDLIQRVADGISAAHGLSADVEFEPVYPVTVNDAPVAERVRALAADLLGESEAVTMPAPIMGAEDFSYVLEKISGAMAFLGGRPRGADASTYPANHSDRVVFDEPAMAIGAALYAHVALGIWSGDG